MELKITIRQELPDDIPAIRIVNEKAFGQPDEAGIVDALRASCDDLISLVAIFEGQVISHILFSPVRLVHGDGVLTGMGLGPLAVLPDHQKQGVGSGLVMAGLEIITSLAYPFVIVLGHPDYYPRFGFQRASLYGIRSQWSQVPEDAFMLLILDKTAMAGIHGIAYYRPEFDSSVDEG